MDLPPAAADPLRLRTSPLAEPLVPGSPYSVLVLQEGYATPLPGGGTRADGTVSLVLGPHLTLVDTGGPWSRERLLAGLAKQGVSPGDIQHVVCTHGHSDHVGNLNLFPQADLFVGSDFSLPDGRYLPTGLRQGAPCSLHTGYLDVLPTPGHAGDDISLMVWGTSLGHVLVAGDLFEHEGDDGEWQPLSQDPARQAASRAYAVSIADVIVPGHGAPFQVFREGTGHPGLGEHVNDACSLHLEPRSSQSCLDILVPAIHIQATGRHGCCGNRCGMFISVVTAAVGLAGSLYALSVSALGLVHGPLCKYRGENGTSFDWGHPFWKENMTSSGTESYLFNPDTWDICQDPVGVTEFNVILFSLILGSSVLELALCCIQVFNGLFGCLCGTCNKEKPLQTFN